MSKYLVEGFDWGSYKPHPAARGVRLFSDPVKFGWEVLPRDEALARYEALISSRTERIAMVTDLALRHGYAADLDREGLAEFNRFFLEKLPVYRGPDAIHGTELVGDHWMSVIWDLGIAIGEAAIDRHPHLRWEFYEPQRRNIIGAQSPSLVGHTKMDPTLPVIHLESYAAEICSPGRTEIVRVKDLDVPLRPLPIRRDLFLKLSETEDRLA